MKTCECDCGCEHEGAGSFCEECKIFLVEECGCAWAHTLEQNTFGHHVVRIEEV